MKKPPYDTKVIANFFLGLADAEKIPLTPMKLRKLVYYAHGWHLGLTGKPLLNEEVQAWSFGPVLMSLYKEFADFHSEPINRKATEWECSAGANILDFITREPSIDDYEADSKVFAKELLERVWHVYSGYSATQLSNITHAPGTPWDQVNKRHKGKIPKYATIPDELIETYFREQVKSA
jgi:uncharacterized phage-associated protein